MKSRVQTLPSLTGWLKAGAGLLLATVSTVGLAAAHSANSHGQTGVWVGVVALVSAFGMPVGLFILKFGIADILERR